MREEIKKGGEVLFYDVQSGFKIRTIVTRVGKKSYTTESGNFRQVFGGTERYRDENNPGIYELFLITEEEIAKEKYEEIRRVTLLDRSKNNLHYIDVMLTEKLKQFEIVKLEIERLQFKKEATEQMIKKLGGSAND